MKKVAALLSGAGAYDGAEINEAEFDALILPGGYGEGVRATIGTDKEVANAFISMGGEHVECEVNDIVVCNQHKVASTPAYMLAKSIKDAESGIKKLVTHVLSVA